MRFPSVRFTPCAAAVIACFSLLIRCEAGDGRSAASLSDNLVENGDFHIWDGGGPVVTTSVGVPAGSLPKDWYGGPGVGATATYELVDSPADETDARSPRRYLRISWSVAPSADWPGEAHHVPAFRFSFVEYFGIRDVRALAGKTVRFSFRARVIGEPVDVIPIMWHSYDASTHGIMGIKGKGYELFESPGIPGVIAIASGEPNPAAICRLTAEWTRHERVITLPAVEGRSITAGHYTGVGFDLHQRKTPTIELADIAVIPVDAGE